MKLTTQFRTVDYFGIKLQVSEDVKFIATDEDGSVFTYTSEVEPINQAWLRKNNGELSHASKIAEVDLEGMNWHETLLEITEADNEN